MEKEQPMFELCRDMIVSLMRGPGGKDQVIRTDSMIPQDDRTNPKYDAFYSAMKEVFPALDEQIEIHRRAEAAAWFRKWIKSPTPVFDLFIEAESYKKHEDYLVTVMRTDTGRAEVIRTIAAIPNEEISDEKYHLFFKSLREAFSQEECEEIMRAARKERKTAQPICVNKERPFLKVLWFATTSIYQFKETWRKDEERLIRTIALLMRRWAKELGHAELVNSWSDPEDCFDGPWYIDIVLGLYELLTRSYINEERQRDIWWILENFSTHYYHQFLKLTNPRHNPNLYSREYAISILYSIVYYGKTGRGNFRGERWRKGAQYRIDQLKKAGRTKFTTNYTAHPSARDDSDSSQGNRSHNHVADIVADAERSSSFGFGFGAGSGFGV